MTNQQAYLLKLLKEIHEICVKHNIVYFLAGGSLIGALRHDGFLPWDDDADLYMTRDNWEKFAEACKTDLPPNRALEAPDINPWFSNTFPRYIATDSTRIHSHQILDVESLEAVGEVIDILILDPISDDEKIRQEYTYNLMIYSELANPAGCFGRRFGVKARHFFKYLVLSKLRGKEYIQSHFEKKLESCFSESGKQYAMRWGGTPLYFDRDWFEKVEMHHFEDLDAMCPGGSNEYLVCHYGDEWPLLPPNAERSSHDAAFLTGVSYKDALKNYRPSFNKKKLANRVTRRKLMLLAGADRDYALQKTFLSAQALKVQMEMNHKLEADRIDYERACENGDYAFLADFFKDYFDWQLSARAIGRDDWSGIYRFNHPILSDLGPNLMIKAIETLMFTERIGKAYRLIEVIEANGNINNPQIASLKDTILVFREAVTLYERKQFKKAMGVLDGLLERYPNNSSFYKLKLCLLFEGVQSSFEERNSFIKQALSLFSDDGFFKKYYADLLEEIGDHEVAMREYRVAAESTLNGLVLLDIKNKTGIVPHIQSLILGDEELSGNNLGEPESKHAPIDACWDSNQEYMFGLLCELLTLCNSRNIKYFLSPKAAYLMHEKNVLPNMVKDYCIYVDSANYKRILEELPSLLSDNRAIEYMGNNPNFMSYDIHYVGCDSLYAPIRTAINTKYKGFFVTIKLLKADSYSLGINILYKIWKSSNYRYNQKPTIRHFCASILGKLGKRFAWKQYSAILIKKILHHTAFSKIYKVSIGKKNYRFPKEMFQNAHSFSFKGYSFSVPKNFFCYTVPCRRWANLRFGEGMRFRNDTIASSQVPFSKYWASSGLSKKYFRNRRLSYLWNSYPRKVRKQFLKAFKEVKIAVSLKGLMMNYIESKETIINLGEKGDFESLVDIFEPYKKAMRQYHPNLYVPLDKEIHEVFLSTLLFQGDLKLFEKLKGADIECN